MKIEKSLLLITILCYIFIAPAFAQVGLGSWGYGTNVTAIADRVNWYNSERHNITVNYTGKGSVIHADFIFPAGWAVIDNSTNCANNSGLNISCNLSTTSGWTASGSFVVASPKTAPPPLYNVTAIKAVTNESDATSNTMKFLRIRDAEIFYTLIEYGRGRGNYFVNTMVNNTDGTLNGVPFLPNETSIELNYLHKIFNVRQYFGLPTAKAYNVTWTCVYPNDTVTRTHLATSIMRSGAIWNTTYGIDELEGSFERMGYMTQLISNGTYAVDKQVMINCTSIKYFLPEIAGNISINNNGLNLTIKKKYPFAVQGNATSSPIGAGTQEIIINYTINNTETFAVDDVSIEISAPTYSSFIGVRGELFGSAVNKYKFSRARFGPNQTESILLVARFNTTGMSGITSLNVTGTDGVTITYVTPWDANAYNPLKTTQIIRQSNQNGLLAVDTSLTPSITSIFDELRTLRLATLNINATISSINETIRVLNGTLFTVNATLTRLNSTVSEINITLISTRNTAYAINATVLGIQNTVNAVNGTVTQINTTVTEIKNTVNNINTTVTYINATVNYINTSGVQVDSTNIINNITDARDKIIQNVSLAINITMNQTSAILNDIRRLREFDEELVFLVTDSFGLQQQATQEASRGETQEALQSLAQANDKLKEAAQRLYELQQQGQNNAEIASPDISVSDSLINILTIIIIIACAGAYFYFTRPPGKLRTVQIAQNQQ